MAKPSAIDELNDWLLGEYGSTVIVCYREAQAWPLSGWIGGRSYLNHSEGHPAAIFLSACMIHQVRGTFDGDGDVGVVIGSAFIFSVYFPDRWKPVQQYEFAIESLIGFFTSTVVPCTFPRLHCLCSIAAFCRWMMATPSARGMQLLRSETRQALRQERRARC